MNTKPNLDAAIDALYSLGMVSRRLLSNTGNVKEGPRPGCPGLSGESDPARPLSLLMFDVLIMLARESELHPSIIAERLSIARSNLTPILTQLKDRGLIEMLEDSADKRRIRIVISQEGRLMIQMMRDKHINTMKERLGSLHSDQIEELESAAQKINAILRKSLGRD